LPYVLFVCLFVCLFGFIPPDGLEAPGGQY
jgi:hypothetical protein